MNLSSPPSFVQNREQIIESVSLSWWEGNLGAHFICAQPGWSASLAATGQAPASILTASFVTSRPPPQSFLHSVPFYFLTMVLKFTWLVLGNPHEDIHGFHREITSQGK